MITILLSAALANAVHAIPDDGLWADLAAATTNDGAPDGAKRWALSLVSDFLKSREQPHGPLDAFDFAIVDFEAVGRLWSAARLAFDLYRDQEAPLETRHMGDLARYLFERLPTIWADGLRVRRAQDARGQWYQPCQASLAVHLAEQVDALVGFFCIGLRPTGSKDPLALRRAALSALRAVAFPLGVGRAA